MWPHDSHPRPRALLALVAALALPALACSGEDLVLPAEGSPAEIEVVTGDGQAGRVGAELDESLVVRVLDTRERPVAGQLVVFSLAAGAAGAEISPDSVTTNDEGRASAQWTLGRTAGEQRIEARVAGIDEPEPITATIRASAAPDAADTIFVARGDKQVGVVGQLLADSLVVRVTDRFGNGVAGVEVQWTASGGGSVSADATATGADGHAGVRRVLGGDTGEQSAHASASGLDGSPAVFEHTALGDGNGALALSLAQQPPSTATSGEQLSRHPIVQVRDVNGDPVGRDGIAVTVAIASGGGSLGGTTTRTTNDDGRAEFSNLVISGSAGTRTLIFAADGIASVTSAPIDVASGSSSPGPSRISIVRGDDQTAPVGTNVPVAPAVRVVDGEGRPVRSVQVTFTVTGGGGSVSDPTDDTNSDGIAEVDDWRLGSSPGTNTLRATAPGVSGDVTFSATATAEPPAGSEPAELKFTVQPRDVEEGERFDPAVEVSVLDEDGEVVTDAEIEIRLELVDDREEAVLRGTTSRRSSNGVARFDNIYVDENGRFTLRARADGLPAEDSARFEVERD